MACRYRLLNRSRRLRSARGAVAFLAASLSCSSAFALFSGVELTPRDFPIGKEYYLDIAPYEYALRIRDLWGDSMLEPRGPRGYRQSYGSTSGAEAYSIQDMDLRIGLDDPFSWRFRLFEGEAPDGRFRHIWTGIESLYHGRWSTYSFAEPFGEKELTDIGKTLGHETRSDSGGLRNRWEVRFILVDIPFDDTNDRNASQNHVPIDLQVSSTWGLGERSWVQFDLDVGFPFNITFRNDPGATPEEQNFVFDYEKIAVSIAANLRAVQGDVLWLEYRGETSERGRRYFGPGPVAEDFGDDYDLSIFRAEWWRGLTDDLQISFGYEFVDFNEDLTYPNDTVRSEIQDRTDHILSLQLRKRFSDEFYLTTGLWLDILDRKLLEPGMVRRTEDRLESNFSIIFEFPTTHGEAKGGGVLFGATIDLDRGFSGHGFIQVGVTF